MWYFDYFLLFIGPSSGSLKLDSHPEATFCLDSVGMGVVVRKFRGEVELHVLQLELEKMRIFS